MWVQDEEQPPLASLSPGGYVILLVTEQGGPGEELSTHGLFLPHRRAGEPRAAQPHHRAQHGRLCVAALQSLREDPDPMVSCLATQICYVLEAKETPSAPPPTSCFCTGRP